jgi:predicted nucleotidyltransferase
MLTKNEIKNRIRRNADILREYHVNKIGIFGSYVHETQNPESDVDLVVDFSDSVTLFQYVHLADSITSFLNQKVDLVTVDGIKPIIKDKVLKEVEWVEGL